MECVEQRILIKYNRPVGETLAIFARNGLTTQQVANQFGCGTSNITRLARKHNVKFTHPHTAKMKGVISKSGEFNEPNLNKVNFLSRQWQ